MSYISTNKDTKDISVTIYNNDFAVVHEIRSICIPDEESIIHYLDVAQNIETNSLIVKGLEIEELNYEYDLVNRDRLLKKYVDKTVFIYNKEKGKEEFRLLSIADALVLENTETKEIVINPDGELILPTLPDGLITKPALIWKINDIRNSEIEVSYLTKGIKWSVDYTINLKENCFDLEGWVNVVNNSCSEFNNARVKLLAGDVHRKYSSTSHSNIYEDNFDNDLEEYCEHIESKELFDYHMFTLKKPTSLKNNEDKQVGFIYKKDVACEKYYDFYGNRENPNIILEFTNNVDCGLGMPLPKGNMKVYAQNKEDNCLEFIGEDSIDHTTINESIKLDLGNAFDVICLGEILERKRLNDELMYIKYHFITYNAGYEDKQVRFYYTFPNTLEKILGGSDGLIDTKGKRYNSLVFSIVVPPENGEDVWFEYTYRDAIPVKVIKDETNEKKKKHKNKNNL